MMAVDRAVTDEVAALERWSAALAEVHARVAHRFRRVEVRERARRYLSGLLARVERKNGWQLAEAMGRPIRTASSGSSTRPRGTPTGCATTCAPNVIEHLGDAASGVLIVDETGFLKQGTRSCGVARQYCGTAGTTANAQIGVFLAYASDRGTAFIERALSLPRAWARDRARRAAVGTRRGPASPPRSRRPSGCSRGPSPPGCPRAGWSRTRSTAGRTRSGVGWSSGGARRC